MIEAIRIENFRCFSELTVNGLGLVNVVVGGNGSGKTALMESISLGMGGGPEQAIKFRHLRGLGGTFALSVLRSSYEALWQDLFHQHDQKRTVAITLSGSAETRRTLRIFYRPDEEGSAPLVVSSGVAAGTGQDSSVIIPITFEWTDAEGRMHPVQAKFVGRELSFVGPPLPGLSAFYSSAFVAVSPPTESANQFSAISRSMRDRLFRRTLKEVFPEIDFLSVEMNMGTPMLYCKVPWVPEKVPVGMVSAGVHKLMSILLGITAHEKGVVLIDEIENGLYYKALPKVWQALLTFAKTYKVQLFVSTHSRECLSAALGTIRRNEKAFRLLRVENRKGARAVRLFGGEDIEAAIETETEVR